MNKNDLRYIKTHKALREAFEKILLEKDLRDINVTSITSFAGLNRRTFYLHYDAVDDMFKELADEQAKEIIARISGMARDSHSNITSLVKSLIDFICSDKKLHKKIICSSDYQLLFNAISGKLTSEIAPKNMNSSGTEGFTYRLYLESISFMIINSIRLWLIEDEPVTKEVLAEMIIRMIPEKILNIYLK